MFPLWRQIICVFTVFLTAQCMTVRRQTEREEAPTSLPKKEADSDYDSAEVSGEDWEEVFQKNSPWNDTALLPTSVYNFQTGEVSFFNWDLNSSAANNHPKSQQYPTNTIPVEEIDLTSREDRPRRYSSKYAKAEESNIDENYEILKEPKPDGDSSETTVPEDKENLRREENEQYEVYEQHKKPAVLDNEKAESGHESKKPESKKHSEGSGEEHHEDHHNKKKTKGLKDYKGEHHYHKGEKGHHDKEGHKGQYSDKKGSTKKHHEGGGHFEAGVHGEKGQKEAKHSDKEEYKKGHSTRGGHVVHKKDEYEKKHEFYDEHHEGGDSEKHGEYHEQHQAKSGGHKKGGHKQGEAAGEHKAKKGHYEKGNKFHEHKGHKKAGGHEKKHGHDEKYGKKEAHSDWKKFGYESGKGGKGGGDSGGAHSNVGHLLAVPPPPSASPQAQVPRFHDQGGKDTVPIPTAKIVEEKEEIRPAKALPASETSAVYDESAPIPSTELRPPPFLVPKFIVFIAPSEGSEFPLFLHRSSVLDKPMNSHQFRASINRLQDLDSFPGIGENRMHRIVKKQMTGSDFEDAGRNKRAVANSLETPLGFARGGAGDGADFNSKDGEKAEGAISKSEILQTRNAGEATTNRSFLKWLKDFAKGKESLFQKEPRKDITPKTEGRTNPGREEDQIQGDRIRLELQRVNKLVQKPTMKPNSYLCSEIIRVPDQHDYRCYYECESNRNGCLRLSHKRCPQGEFFSYKYLRCLRADRKRSPSFRQKKSADFYGASKRPEPYDLNTDDQEPSNEWLDASQGLGQKIPSEFKPKKKPALKIYHLRVKRTPDKRLRKEVQGVNREWAKSGVTRVDGVPVSDNSVRGVSKIREIKRHHPRSYVIRANKKEGKDDRIIDSSENDNDNDDYDEEADEDEEDDEETDDEDEDGEGDDTKEVTEETPHKETLKDLLKSAKEAVTNRVRFEDPTQIAPRAVKPEANHSNLNGKKSDDSTQLDKKVLIDANIKVDGTLGNVLRSFLKSKKKDLEFNNKVEDGEAFVSDRESQDKLDPELLRTYENLMRNNPRVKRYFLVNCSSRRN